jgi:hypothetical protein
VLPCHQNFSRSEGEVGEGGGEDNIVSRELLGFIELLDGLHEGDTVFERIHDPVFRDIKNVHRHPWA